ncbi:MAG: hypothetical protein KDA58_09990, partial [Planctomycetaceae bacterium]|nr:hypothetical protein [Planctomycetaceae bacterium]
MPTTHDRLHRALLDAASEPSQPLWLVLIGHGTFDGRLAKLNLVGTDVSTEDLQAWCAPLQRPLAVIGSYSASGALIEQLSAPRRVIVTSTKNAAEVNFSRFGGLLATSLADASADLDKDQQVSLLEAFVKASRKTREFYEADGRIETEHALLDDNGDAKGTRADAFRGLTPVATPEDAAIRLDGPFAHQWHAVPSTRERQLGPEIAAQRDSLELRIAELKQRRAQLTEEDYYHELEALLVPLAELLTDDPATSGPAASNPGSELKEE